MDPRQQAKGTDFILGADSSMLLLIQNEEIVVQKPMEVLSSLWRTNRNSTASYYVILNSRSCCEIFRHSDKLCAVPQKQPSLLTGNRSGEEDWREEKGHGIFSPLPLRIHAEHPNTYRAGRSGAGTPAISTVL